MWDYGGLFLRNLSRFTLHDDKDGFIEHPEAMVTSARACKTEYGVQTKLFDNLLERLATR
jgi:hypothetical protein